MKPVKLADALSTKQAAEFLGLSERGLRWWIYHNKPEMRLEPDTRVGNALVFSRATLRKFAKKHGFTTNE